MRPDLRVLRDARATIERKKICVLFLDRAPSEGEWNALCQRNRVGITDQIFCVPIPYYYNQEFFAVPTNYVLWLDGFFDLRECEVPWKDLALGEAGSFDLAAVASLICDILIPKDKIGVAKGKLEEALRNAPDLNSPKEDWSLGENEGSLDASASVSDASDGDADDRDADVLSDDEGSDTEMTDYLAGDDEESAALKSENTSALPRRDGDFDFELKVEILADCWKVTYNADTFKLKFAVWEACWKQIHETESKFHRNRLTEEQARKYMFGIIGWWKGWWFWETVPSECGYWETMRSRFPKWAERGVLKIPMDAGVVEFSKLPKCWGKAKGFLRIQALPGTSERGHGTVTGTVLDACWSRIFERDNEFAINWGKRGVRTLLEGILYKLLNDIAWNKVPKRYGAEVTLRRKYIDWVVIGVFEILVKSRYIPELLLVPIPRNRGKQLGQTPWENAARPVPRRFDLQRCKMELRAIIQNNRCRKGLKRELQAAVNAL
jgi:hypothetical protein